MLVTTMRGGIAVTDVLDSARNDRLSDHCEVDGASRSKLCGGTEIAAHLPGARNDGGGVVVAMTDRRRRSQKQRQGG